MQKGTAKNKFLQLNKRYNRSMVKKGMRDLQTLFPLPFYHATILRGYSVNINLYLSPKIFQHLFSLYLGSCLGRYHHEINKT